MNLTKTQRRVIYLIIGLILGEILWLLDVPGHDESHTQPVIDSRVIQPKIELSACITEEGQPCSWLSDGVKHAYMDGALGPKTIRVPAAVRKHIRQAVFARGPRFTRRVKHNLPWFTRDYWVAHCAMSVAYRQITGSYYPRCMTRKQAINNVGFLKHMTLGCGKEALIGGVASKAAGAIKAEAGRAGMWISIGTGLNCMGNTLVDYANKNRDYLWKGFISAVPRSATPWY